MPCLMARVLASRCSSPAISASISDSTSGNSGLLLKRRCYERQSFQFGESDALTS